MSDVVPDPNLVVEALRNIADDPNRATFQVQRALPHAEVIAEMWDWTMPQAAAVQELIAAGKGLEDDLGFPGPRHARLRAALEAMPV